jgi:hypothetical protein
MIAMEKKTYGSVQALLFPRNPGGAACRLCVSTILNSYSKHAWNEPETTINIYTNQVETQQAGIN